MQRFRIDLSEACADRHYECTFQPLLKFQHYMFCKLLSVGLSQIYSNTSTPQTYWYLWPALLTIKHLAGYELQISLTCLCLVKKIWDIRQAATLACVIITSCFGHIVSAMLFRPKDLTWMDGWMDGEKWMMDVFIKWYLPKGTLRQTTHYCFYSNRVFQDEKHDSYDKHESGALKRWGKGEGF